MYYVAANGTIDAFRLSQSVIIRDGDGRLQIGHPGDYIGVSVGNGFKMGILSADEMTLLSTNCPAPTLRVIQPDE